MADSGCVKMGGGGGSGCVKMGGERVKYIRMQRRKREERDRIATCFRKGF